MFWIDNCYVYVLFRYKLNKKCENWRKNNTKNITWMRSDFKVWRFCPRTATLNSWRWFSSLQLERARPNHMNRKIETFKRCLVMQKTLVKVMHRKIVFVKVESSVVEISKSLHWSRRCYAIGFISVWNEILLLAHSWFNSYALELVPMFHYRDKTRVHIFYFLNQGPLLKRLLSAFI